MRFVYDLAEHGTTLATRPFAKELRCQLLDLATDQAVVELDFNEVRSVSHSFADEFVCHLAEESKNGEIGIGVTVSGASPEVQRVIAAALARRGIQLPELV